MENGIAEGLNQAFLFYLSLMLGYAAFSMTAKVNLPQGWFSWILSVVYWLGGVLIATAAITGLVTQGNMDSRIASYVFAIIVGGSLYGLSRAGHSKRHAV